MKVILSMAPTLNKSFMEAKLIDEIYFTIHPLIFGKRIPLFAENDVKLKLKLLGVENAGKDLLRVHYKVV